MDCRERILSNNYADIITDYPISPQIAATMDLCYINLDNLYNIVYINRMGLLPLPDNIYTYHNMPKLYGLMQLQSGENTAPFDVGSLAAAGITQVQRPPLSLTGRGVVVCLIDTGIDYTSPAFRDEAGNTRILALWDQTIQDGEAPEGLPYGTEYTREDINRALQSEDPYSAVPSRDTNGHGSAMAGVAAGSRVGGGRDYLGAAPDAELVVVKLKECKPYFREYYMVPEDVPAYQETDIMLALKYVDSFAVMFRRPVVICLGVGTNMGEHAGGSALSGYMTAIAGRRSRAMVVCGGNEGNASHHFQGNLTDRTAGQENYQDVEIRVGENSMGFFLEFWGNAPDVYNVAIRSPGGETIAPFRIGLRQSITYGFIYERTRITVYSALIEPNSGLELILFRVQEPTPGIWNFRVAANGEIHNGIFHMWLPITEFLNAEAYFLEPSPYTTLTSPSLAVNVISVSTYNDVNNSFYINSGRGFGMDNRIAPHFSAPGVNVPTIYGRRTGSSLAAAIAAGGIAQFMQWAVVEQNNPLVETREVRNYFIRGASRSADLTYPNREWGYGRMSVMGTFDALAGV